MSIPYSYFPEDVEDERFLLPQSSIPTLDTINQATAIDQRSGLERFIGAFFQERNIKWMLVIGAAIVFGSSLMLVNQRFESWPTSLKYLTILGYTAATFGFAEFGRRRLGLRATAQVLHLLTLFLLPVTFLALNWLSSGTATQNTLAAIEVPGLMIPAAAFLWFASTRIFDFLLRGRQTTFVASYILLCIAGALPGMENPVIAAGLSAVLWAVMTVGVVKINRHMFWMAEEKQWPRVFGFLPIAILGLQFISLVWLKSAAAIPVAWLGPGCVMLAATILLTTRTIADVFRQRTGNLVRPLPWHVAIPLFVGFALTIASVVVAGVNFPDVRPVVPTAIVAAILMGVAAKDTRHSGFVWTALVFLTVAYQFTPAFFRELAFSLRDSAAGAIGEHKLPIAFYGLTYLPLLIGLSYSSRILRLRNIADMSRPIQHFVTFVSAILFAVALTNLKACFMVSCVNVALYLVYATLFADRRYSAATLLSLILAVGSVVPFLNQYRSTADQLPLEMVPTALAALAMTLVATRIPDRILSTIPLPPGRHPLFQRFDESSRSICQHTGFGLATMLSLAWIAAGIWQIGATWSQVRMLQFGLLLSVFILHTLRTRHYLSGLSVSLLLAIGGVTFIAGQRIPPAALVAWSTIATAVVSVAGYTLVRLTANTGDQFSWDAVRRQLGLHLGGQIAASIQTTAHGGRNSWAHAFVVPMCDLSLILLSILAVGFHLPQLLYANATLKGLLVPVATSVLVLWMIAAARGLRSGIATVMASVLFPVWVTAIVTTVAPGVLSYAMLPLIWSIAAASMMLIFRRRTARLPDLVCQIAALWFMGIILACLAFVSWPLRAASIISLAGILVLDYSSLTPSRRTWLAIVTNLNLILAALGLTGFSGFAPTILLATDNLISVAAILLPLLGISALFFDHKSASFEPVMVQAWSGFLRVAGAVTIFVSFMHQGTAILPSILVLVGFGTFAVAEFVEALRRKHEDRVWASFTVISTAVLWMFTHHLIEFGAGISQFVLLGLSVIMLIVCRQIHDRESIRVLARPFRMVGLILPIAVACMGIVREFSGREVIWPGANSLALLCSAGLYFHHGIVRRERGFIVLAGAILNVSLLLLWRTLHLIDPQFYMVPIGLSILGLVELMKKELPKASHDLLRYIGALTILVSPTFEILGGSWLHLITLMVLSVVVVLVAIGLQLKALMYTGSAFLLADLVGMIVRSTIDHPALLWVCGLGLGAAVIGLAAYCERHREDLLKRIRIITSELATWN
jgi:hypothetical protein